MLMTHAGYEIEVTHDTASDSYRATLTCPLELIRYGLRANPGWERQSESERAVPTIECPHESNCVGRDRDRCVATVVEHQRQHERTADHVGVPRAD